MRCRSEGYIADNSGVTFIIPEFFNTNVREVIFSVEEIREAAVGRQVEFVVVLISATRSEVALRHGPVDWTS